LIAQTSKSTTAPQNRMTGLALIDGRSAIKELQLFLAIGVMRLMAADARRRIFVLCLPARQEDVKVIVKVTLRGDIGVAFEAVRIFNRAGVHRRLGGASRRPCQQVLCA
jgi:hypothetical protein